ncbi:putative glutamate receptor [Araneus ventricosus]|uniref:Putative glutamate receptor n=1 Tax=Araneus ventricosus TaxID=182803 RepID=A0A4Y2EF15_ARAVE|nr:putative glutamate receptor [Araneus ventricosus]
MSFEKVLRVAVLQAKHIVEVNESTDGKILPLRGIEVRLLNLLSQCMHFKYDLVIPQDREFGRTLDDGQWTGMIGLVVREEADFAMNMIALTGVRREVLNFSYPYNVDGTTFFMEAPALLPKGLAYFYPFGFILWVSVLFSMFLAPFVFKYVFRNAYSLSKLFFEVTGSFLGLPFNAVVQDFGSRILLLSWLVYVKILALCYCAVLLSFVTIPLKTEPIQNINQLANVIKEGKCNGLIFRGTSDHNAFYSAASGPLKVIADHVKENNKLVPHGLTITEYIPDSKTALIGSKSLVQFNYLSENYKQYAISKDFFYTTLIAIPVSDNFCCLQKMDTCIHRMYAGGLYEKFMEDEIYILTMKSMEKQDLSEDDLVLRIADIYGAFLILAVGCAISCFAFVFEVLYKKKK